MYTRVCSYVLYSHSLCCTSDLMRKHAHAGLGWPVRFLFLKTNVSFPKRRLRSNSGGLQAFLPTSSFPHQQGAGPAWKPVCSYPYFKVTVFKTPARLLPSLSAVAPTPLLPPDPTLRGHIFKTKTGSHCFPLIAARKMVEIAHRDALVERVLYCPLLRLFPQL